MLRLTPNKLTSLSSNCNKRTCSCKTFLDTYALWNNADLLDEREWRRGGSSCRGGSILVMSLVSDLFIWHPSCHPITGSYWITMQPQLNDIPFPCVRTCTFNPSTYLNPSPSLLVWTSATTSPQPPRRRHKPAPALAVWSLTRLVENSSIVAQILVSNALSSAVLDPHTRGEELTVIWADIAAALSSGCTFCLCLHLDKGWGFALAHVLVHSSVVLRQYCRCHACHAYLLAQPRSLMHGLRVQGYWKKLWKRFPPKCKTWCFGTC